MAAIIKFVMASATFFIAVKASLLNFQCTRDGDRCVIPFTHGRDQYFQCAMSDNLLWCPTRALPTGRYDIGLCTFCEAPSVCYIRADEMPSSSWQVDCPPGCINITTRLWISRKDPNRNYYSVDSFVCAAAIQEGRINAAVGGTVAIRKKGQNLHGVSRTFSKGNFATIEEERMAPLFSLEDTRKRNPLPRLLFSNRRDVRVVSNGRAEVLVKNQENVVAIALDTAKNILYWSDVSVKKIFRANLTASSSGENQVQVMSSLQVKRPDGMAIDWIHNLLYWTDANLHTVSVSTDLGKHAKSLISRPAEYVPRDIALDPKRGYMYITDWGTEAKIERCSMSGADSCTTVVGHDIAWPNGVTLDIENNLMYWVDARLNSISVATTDGEYRRNLVSSKEIVKHPYSVMVHSNRLYWTDWNRGILSVNKDTGQELQLHFMDLNRPNGVALYGAEHQPEYPNHCQRQACKYLCLPDLLSSRCACPDGYVTAAHDKTDCTPLASSHADEDDVLTGFIDHNEYETYDAHDSFQAEKMMKSKLANEEL